MTINEGLRLIAGVFILISLGLSLLLSDYWLIFTGFIALNLIQSAFTGWCPMVWLLSRLGFKEEQVV